MPPHTRMMRVYTAATLGLLVLLLCVPLLVAGLSGGTRHEPSAGTSADIYYKTPGTPSAAAAPVLREQDYPAYWIPGTAARTRVSNRDAIWFANQQHIYVASFVLAMPVYALLLEIAGLITRNRRYDALAREYMRVGLGAFAFAALLGGLLLTSFLVFYPGFFGYLARVFKPLMPLYALMFLALTAAFYLYYYGWDGLTRPEGPEGNVATAASPRARFGTWLHLTVGGLLNLWAYLLLIVTNAWVTFMMAPSGVDEQGRFLGNAWRLLHTTLWAPANLHRFLTNGVFAGGIMAAYAAYRFLQAESREERAHYDWMGYLSLLLAALFLLPQPFIGYWFARRAYGYSQQMGIALMGGTLGWFFILVAVLFGTMLLVMTYYLWLSMGRLDGSDRYFKYVKYLLVILGLAFAVWVTPHTYLLKPEEGQAIRETYHPLVGPFGIMAAKKGAANVMILTVILTYLLYQRCNRVLVARGRSETNAVLTAVFLAAYAHVIWLSLYGSVAPSNIQVALALPQSLTTITAAVVALALNRAVIRRAAVIGQPRWGEVSVRAQYALLFLGVAFTWLMGFMGYIRSSSRLTWHVYHLVSDASTEAFTQILATVANGVSLNVIVSGLVFLVVFWLSRVPRAEGQARAGAPE